MYKLHDEFVFVCVFVLFVSLPFPPQRLSISRITRKESQKNNKIRFSTFLSLVSRIDVTQYYYLVCTHQ